MNTPERFTKKPVTVEAMQLTLDNIEDVRSWISKHGRASEVYHSPTRPVAVLYIATPEARFEPYGGEWMQVEFGDWIIRGVKGELYRCEPDIFDSTYTLAGLNPDTMKLLEQAHEEVLDLAEVQALPMGLPADITPPVEPSNDLARGEQWSPEELAKLSTGAERLGFNTIKATPPVDPEVQKVVDLDRAALEELAKTETLIAALAVMGVDWSLPPGTMGIVAERRRQIEVESFDADNDDDYDRDELVGAALSYLWNHWFTNGVGGRPPICWPWEERWYKPKDRRRDLERAGALIAAELARMDRVEASKKVEAGAP